MNASERIKLQPCWVLHRRDFRDSSQIVDIFSRDYGRVGMVARGVKRPKSRHRGVLQPFSPVLLSWVVGRELATLTDAEQGAGQAYRLGQEALMCGFYVNELLLKLTHRFDPNPELFELYGTTMAALADSSNYAATLRGFEWQFLGQIGFGLNLLYEAGTGRDIDDDGHYDVIVDQGPLPVTDDLATRHSVTGKTLRAITASDWSLPETLKAARRILGAALDQQLGGKQLHSRRIVREMRRGKQQKTGKKV